MVDEEVEKILFEIRDRVRAQEIPAPALTNSNTGNGNGETYITSGRAVETSSAEALARIESHLAATGRAWDRLPPVVSNRSGSLARLELWLKRKLKRATHWFTWEQINFNASTHHALRDVLEAQRAAQSSSEQALENLRAENEDQRTTIEQNQARLMSLGAEVEAQRVHIEGQRIQSEAQRVQIEGQRIQSEAQRAHTEAQRSQMNARLSELEEELRERDARMQEEQRVCFKQLSLEATEAAVLEDRARRKNETLLDELKRRVEQIEKK